jgi:hypothetical protein
MKIFKDSKGRTHQVTINVASVRTVRDHKKLDLWRAFDGQGEVLQQLLADPITFVEVVYLLTGGKSGDEAAEADFCRGIDGDTLDRLTTAFQEELLDFFPPPRRAILKRMLGKARELTTAAESQASRQIDALKVEDFLDDLSRRGNGSPTVRPASSDSILPPSR